MLFFPDLGLIVIDEEQRFGVKHKETFERIEKGGCAYLDSYPIPRTLHMSMLEFEICLSSFSDQSVSCANFCIRDQLQPLFETLCCGRWIVEAVLSLQQGRYTETKGV